MRAIPFIARNAAEALVRIHAELGPEAVILSVKPASRQGLARLWPGGGGVEVVAGLAETGADAAGSSGISPAPRHPAWSLPNSRPLSTLLDSRARPHVLIGPPGVGKTTLLCKWMTHSVLQQQLSLKVWRLDGNTANTSEFLNIYAEMLNVPVGRFWYPTSHDSGGTVAPSQCGSANAAGELFLIDLPGVQPDDPLALTGLKEQLASLGHPRVHLVLNIAYEKGLLLKQFRAFAGFEPEDISFCHLDEETDPAKLVEVIAGTNCSLRFLSTGQKVPGDFLMGSEPAGQRPRLAA